MEKRYLKFGKVFQKYLVMNILSYTLDREESFVFLHLLSQTSRKFLKDNYLPITNILLSKWDINYEIIRDSDNIPKIQHNLLLRIFLFGSKGVGKTSLLYYFDNNIYSEDLI